MQEKSCNQSECQVDQPREWQKGNKQVQMNIFFLTKLNENDLCQGEILVELKVVGQ